MATLGFRPPSTTSHHSEDQWLQELGRIRHEVLIPGYWQGLEENCCSWAREISAAPYWKEAEKLVVQWSSEYRRITGGDLLIHQGLPPFAGKGAARIRSKLYSQCRNGRREINDIILPSGPPVPQLNDLVRVRVSCKYIDGVEFLGTKLFELAKEMNCNPLRSREGRIEGYFAQHLLFDADVFYRLGGGAEPARIKCEVQLATDLATRIWDASHVIYEENRESEEEPADWQWNPDDPRFLSRQLGHMIHLADGLLVRLREVVKVDKNR